MKIISKYKDYYDYLTGIFGIDPLKVIDRTTGSCVSDISESKYTNIAIYFCGYWYVKIVRNENEIPLGFSLYNYASGNKLFEILKEYEENGKIIKWYKSIKFEKLDLPIYKASVDNYRYWKASNKSPYPRLSDYDFGKIIPPETAYISLESFISYQEPVIENKPEDMYRFESKGFDKKKSFRKKI